MDKTILPGLPAPRVPVDLSKCWTMFYRHGVNAVLSKNFFCEGSLRDAVERAQKHCGIMGYKYNFLRPMVCDIEIEEGVQLGKLDARTHQPRTQGIESFPGPSAA